MNRYPEDEIDREALGRVLRENGCLIAVTREVTKFGDIYWVVWRDGIVVSEEESEASALVVARSFVELT
jgi:hypothetical protein